ncbi:LOW QUALITY PROTEIN: hypothetical protein NC651_019097 [Populus alba x Populus x berolinensis]|nr:LOW QUALITY PROTEIN: hypothetical protein NC651_019097 [Populus alba x Populus x berolinensis]
MQETAITPTIRGIAYLNYPVVVKAQTSSSSALCREPMLPPFNVLITGSTKELVDAFNPGIGYALAKEFLKAGDNVIICSRWESAVQRLREEFGEQRVWGTKCDVREGKDVKDLVAFAQESLKYIDIWINNAGSNAYSYKPLAEASDEELIEVVTTNTLGLMICCREAIKMMLNQPRGGHIFNIDGAGSDGRPTPRLSCRSKMFKNVVVHNLSPGMVTTDLIMSGATTKQAKFFINVLAEPAEVVAEYLVPNIRSIPANGSAKPTYIRFLTGVKHTRRYSQYLLSAHEETDTCLKIESVVAEFDLIQMLTAESALLWLITLMQSFQDMAYNSAYVVVKVCYEDNITQLHIVGNSGVPPTFSTDYFFANVASLSSLKVLSLVSLGFSGPLPESIGQLSSLEILNASSNYFSGSIPASLSSLRSLQTLILDHNKFSGEVPGWLEEQFLSGYLPNSLTRLESLRILSLSKNHLSGQVPDLHNLTNLQVLELEDNHFGPDFQDHFLPSLLSRPPMNYLDISHNKFTGMLFENMSCHAELAYSYPTCLNLSSESRIVLYARNCLSNKEQEQHPFNICHNEALAVKILPRDDVKHQRHDKEVLASSTTGGVVGGIAIVGWFSCLSRGKDDVKKPQTRILVKNLSSVNTVKLLSDARYISQTMKLGASLPNYRTFSLEELKEATNNFDASNLLSEDSNSQMYKGKLNDGSLVAIRSSKVRKKISQLLWDTALIAARMIPASSRIFNIFEFVPNGTLRDYISGAAIGAARGIQFLHTGIVPGVFPNNLKITDVVLDHDLLVKLCSYNLPLLNEGSVGAAVSSGTKQNFGTRDRHEDKEDIYDLGVILVEIISKGQWLKMKSPSQKICYK